MKRRQCFGILGSLGTLGVIGGGSVIYHQFRDQPILYLLVQNETVERQSVELTLRDGTDDIIDTTYTINAHSEERVSVTLPGHGVYQIEAVHATGDSTQLSIRLEDDEPETVLMWVKDQSVELSVQ